MVHREASELSKIFYSVVTTVDAAGSPIRYYRMGDIEKRD
jgi:hypothetical protein